jgi:hypothetical protein
VIVFSAVSLDINFLLFFSGAGESCNAPCQCPRRSGWCECVTASVAKVRFYKELIGITTCLVARKIKEKD